MLTMMPPRRRPCRAALLALLLAPLAAACADEIPPAWLGYEQDCLKMNAAPLPITGDDDPHKGEKDVWACNVTVDQLIDTDGAPILPYPEGALILKSATRPEQGWVWLVTTAEKVGGDWVWKEYTRNFDSEPFLLAAVPESTCTECHADARDQDWIFTTYAP